MKYTESQMRKHTNLKYETARNKLIPDAARWADKAGGPGGADQRWNHAFAKRMEHLAKREGLTK